MKIHLQKIGTAGLFLTAIMSPCCFPLFGFILTAFGIGSFELFGKYSMITFMGLTLLSMIGFAISRQMHKCLYPLLIAIPSALLIICSYYFIEADYWRSTLYVGMFGMLAASVVDFYQTRKYRKSLIPMLQSVITCPECGHKKEETMPTDSCTFFYECENCKRRLKPKAGDCCVFCSYGTIECPPIQLDRDCCGTKISTSKTVK